MSNFKPTQVPLRLAKGLAKKLLTYKHSTFDQRKYKIRSYYPLADPCSRASKDWLYDLLKALFTYKSGVFIDVGANIGQTLLKVISVDESRDYVGLEPNSQCFISLEQLITTNRLSHCQVLPIGLSNHHNVVRFLEREGADDAGSIIGGFRPESFYSNSKLIFVAPGDSIIESLDLSSIAVIKIDVEGAELEVIEGFRKSINQYKPFIIFEVLPHYLNYTNESLDKETTEFRTKRIKQIETILREEGYSIFQIHQKADLEEVASIDPGALPDLSSANYLAMPSDAAGGVLTLVTTR